MKPLVKSVATTAVVLAALAGCASRSSESSSAPGAGGGSTSSSSSASSPSSSSSSSPSTPPSSSGQTGSSSPSNPSEPGTVKYVALQGLSLEKDGITLATEVNWGGCNDQPQLVVKSQDASKVVVELKTVSHARVGVMCPDFSRNGEATVKLDAPLGSRQVVDGVKNVAISVS
ncbi:hypothetical protein Caci_1017 [Catenulispora acidiphila DSM 44928]|uniref:Lipoprotein n=1 Tax=Catenulispora acidiphila (strain DSM 44928 / JCM 14897 / NBRC 102108 / NRRL B-24433 / ID139908) TaxID=479433 RepID=C7Q485_CATAD|nr:hypothetical protein [Catenulispora acidiphila]ACU69945.1 hypothetical protein Caci_1017 [Catenulispora acidiphila DSM 44928]